MPVTTVPAFPLRSQGKTQAQYSSEFEASMTALPLAIADLNAVGSAYALATNATSSTSNTIGTGSKSFTTQTNLGYQIGQSLRIANSSTNFMTGEVTSYNVGTGALVMNISSVVGTGTFTSWFISQSATGASTAAGVSNTPAGNISATTVQAAINELDTEKLSSAAGAVTGTNLEDITTAETVGSAYVIPVVTKDVNGRVTGMTSAQKITSGTVTATTSGTSVDYLSIPSGVKRITLMIAGVSTNGTSNIILQIGDSGGIENTNYLGAIGTILGAGAGSAAFSSGFIVGVSNNASTVLQGSVTLTLLDATTNTWVVSGNVSFSDGARYSGVAGSKALSATLDRIRLTTVNGTDTFDAGSINIFLE